MTTTPEETAVTEQVDELSPNPTHQALMAEPVEFVEIIVGNKKQRAVVGLPELARLIRGGAAIHSLNTRPAPDPAKDVEGPQYLLVKRGLYYCPDNRGYTGIKDNAGRYEKDFANGLNEVTAIHIKDAPDYSEACFEDIKFKHLSDKYEQSTAAQSQLIGELEAAASKALEWWPKGSERNSQAGKKKGGGFADDIIQLRKTIQKAQAWREGK